LGKGLKKKKKKKKKNPLNKLFSRYTDSEDSEYQMLKYLYSDFGKEIAPIFQLIEFLPITRFYYRKEVNRIHKTTQDFIDVITNKYRDHCKDYNENLIRDFCDAVIFAKNEALAEGKESAPYLTDKNLALVIMDLFMGIFFKNFT
jgi:hypothetical protein